MASSNSPNEAAALPSSTESLPSALNSSSRPKKRKAKHHDPPAYHFVTATDPAQFKDPEHQKVVRSKAMVSVKQNEARERERINASMAMVTATPTLAPAVVLPPRNETREGSASFQEIGIESYYNKQDNTYMWAEDWGSYCTLRDEAESPHVHPQYQDLSLNAYYLRKSCHEAFSVNTHHKKGDGVFSDLWILLSSTMLASSWSDMRSGRSKDSSKTSEAKVKVIEMLNERLASPETRFDDQTLVIILHLLVAEMWTSNKKTLDCHRAGITNFIVHCGGIRNFENRVIAEVAAACCLHSNILCEAPIPSIFRSWCPSGTTSILERSWLPESPLFYSSNGFEKLLQDSKCSSNTYELLCDMRDLTDMALAPVACTSQNFYTRKLSEIRRRIDSLPSAQTQGLLTSNDWIYEACRIAAVIYTQAIALRVPFSYAAEMAYDITRETNRLASEPPSLATSLIAALYKVLGRTNTDELWGSLSGVLFWVTIVGAAAASRDIVGDNPQLPTLAIDEDSKRTRPTLRMLSTRTMIMLVLQHPVSIVMGQTKLLQIQELLNSGDYSQRSEDLQPAVTSL